MKASETIKRLEELINLHGDLECGLHDHDSYDGTPEISKLSSIDLTSPAPWHNIDTDLCFIFDV